MRCLLTVPGPAAGGRVARCLSLFPVLDRPFLQHVVEALAARGVTEIVFGLGRHADDVQRFLGSGARWGCRFTYHLTRDPDRPAKLLRAVGTGKPVLLARSDALPALPADLGERSALLDADGEWTGWAVAAAADLVGVPADITWAGVGHLLRDRGAARLPAGPALRLRTLADVPAAQWAALDGRFPGLLCSAREVRPGVWVGRNVSMAPTAELFAPAFVGEFTSLGPGVRVGPGAVVGPDCLLDAGAAVRRATVLPRTYVGPGVEVEGVVIDGRHLIHPVRQTVETVDRHLLDGLDPGRRLTDGVGRLCERAAAAVGFLIATPVLCVAALWLRATRPGPVFSPRRYVRTPAPAHDDAWQVGTAVTLGRPRENEAAVGWVIPPTLSGLVLEVLPALAEVARGELRLVGLPPRAPDALRRLHVERCPALLGTPAGLITEAGLFAGPHGSEDEVILADAYQAHSSRLRTDLGRVIRFLARAFNPWAVHPAPPPDPPTPQGPLSRKIDRSESKAMPCATS